MIILDYKEIIKLKNMKKNNKMMLLIMRLKVYIFLIVWIIFLVNGWVNIFIMLKI